MTAYIFVLGIWNHKEEEMRFHHRIVIADSVDEAYDEGQKLAYDCGLIPVEDGETARDYVIQLVEE